MAFEELGPTFVKFGQLLAARPDLLPDYFVKELGLLQDQAVKLPFDVIDSVLQKELGPDYKNKFSSIDPEPLAAGSIAQVHRARLLDQTEVVLKIQRPEIEQIIKQDVELLELLADLAEKYLPEIQILAPKTFVQEFFRSLFQELDFHLEASNLSKFKRNLAQFEQIVVPTHYPQLSTRRVLTMDFLSGIPLKNVEALRQSQSDLKEINLLGAKAFFKTVMKDGLFHGDLHGGNLFLLPDLKLGLIDFGIVGRLSNRARSQLSQMVMALVAEDFESLCYLYAELGAAGPTVDFESFERDIRSALAPYMGLKASEVNTGQVLIEATRIATKYEIRVPAEWMLIFRAIFTAEGIGRALDPEFDMMALGQELAQELSQQSYNIDKFSRDLLWTGRDISQLIQALPRQLRWMFKTFSQNGFAFEIKSQDLENLRETYEIEQRKTRQTLLGVGLILSSAFFLQVPDSNTIAGYPWLAVVTFVLGVLRVLI